MDYLNIIQITDLHLNQMPHLVSHHQDPDKNLQNILAFIQQHEKNIDALIMTGDLANDGSIEAYQRLASFLEYFPAPVYFVPGNHDNHKNIKYLTGKNISQARQIEFEQWEIILLDSLAPGKESGDLALSERNFLYDSLATQKYKIIALHHHPIPVHHAEFDQIGLNSDTDFVKIVCQNPTVQAVIFGHIHQELALLKEGKLFLACPSTWVQMVPGLDATYAAWQYDVQPPGYRWLRLFADGSLESGIRRL